MTIHINTVGIFEWILLRMTVVCFVVALWFDMQLAFIAECHYGGDRPTHMTFSIPTLITNLRTHLSIYVILPENV